MRELQLGGESAADFRYDGSTAIVVHAQDQSVCFAATIHSWKAFVDAQL